MILRHSRWICTALLTALAVAAGAGRSEAGTQILIEEVDSSGNAVAGQTYIFSGSTVSGINTTNFQNINVTVNSNSGVIGSLTTNVAANPVSTGFDSTHQIEVIVTSDSFTNPNPGQPAAITNNAGASSGLVGGTNSVSNQTLLLATPLSPDTTQTGLLASGTPLGAPTKVATSTLTDSTTPGGTGGTTANLSSLPPSYAIQQTIFVSATPDSGGSIVSGSTVGGTAGTTVLTNAAPVPAPAGLVLALAAAPLFGLRRSLRRKTVSA